MNAIFKPLSGVGPFVIGNKISTYKKDFDFTYSNMIDYEVYTINHPDISLYVESDKIVSINCREECIFDGKNIIGMTIKEFVKVYNLKINGLVDKLDYEDDNVPQYVYEFDNIGLQVWVKNKRIKSVIATTYE